MFVPVRGKAWERKGRGGEMRCWRGGLKSRGLCAGCCVWPLINMCQG